MECGVNIVDSNIDSIYRSVRIGEYVNTDNCRRFDRIGSQTCERGALFVFETLCMKILLIGWEKSGEEIGERKSGRGNQVEGLLARANCLCTTSVRELHTRKTSLAVLQQERLWVCLRMPLMLS